MSLTDSRTTANHNQTVVIAPSGTPQHNQTVVRRTLVLGDLATNHNQTLVLGGLTQNHNQTLVRSPWGTTYQHNQTLVRR